jgi:hypothetical protein
MFIHPDSVGHNPAQQYPEIFEKYEFIRFHLSGERMMDFYDSSSFLYGSQAKQDINMIFSAVQRLSPETFEDFQSYLKKKSTYQQLVGITEVKEMQEKIKTICNEYNTRFGMRRKIIAFYQKYVSDDDKALINSKIFKPVSYKPSRGRTREDGFEFVIDLLLRLRNDLDHQARYTPFAHPDRPFSHQFKIREGDKLIEITTNLTFQDFYEVTRKAVAKFWLEEYEQYLANGGKELIDAMVKEVTEQCRRLNEAAKKEKEII